MSSAKQMSDEAALFEQRMVSTFGMSSVDYADERAQGPVSLAYLHNAMALIKRSGVNEKIAEWDKAQRKSNAGAKRIIPLGAILPIMFLHIQMGRGVVYWDIASTLHSRFQRKHFEMLGIANVNSAKEDWYQRFWQALTFILKLVDPYPFARNGLMKADDYATQYSHITTGEGKTAHQLKLDRINWLCNALVRASVQTTPKEFLHKYRGNASIDASLIPITGAPNPTKEIYNRQNPDPFSGRYRREGNHDGQGAKTDRPGYEVETATMAWNRPHESQLFPSLITAVGFHRPGALVGHGMALIEQHKAAFGLDRFLVMADRAYNNGRINEFHIPARKAGVELVIDYKLEDRGLQGHYRDLILVDGNWHVASMPKGLIEATWELGQLEKNRANLTSEVFQEEKTRLLSRVHNREPYRMIAKGLPDKDGYQRFTYPKDTPSQHKPLDGASTITIPVMVPETDAPARRPGGKSRKLQPIKHVQRFPYMTKDWFEHYGMRNLVESSNSRFKDPEQEDLGNPKKRSGRGFAFQYLATALSIASFNLRAIASFMLKLRNNAVDKPIRTRRRKDENAHPLARTIAVGALAPPV